MFPRRGVAALAITTVALILLLSFKTPDQALPARTGGVAVVDSGTTGSTTTSGDGGTNGSSSVATPAPAAADGTTASTTVEGPVISTRFGPVQVSIVVSGGQIQDVVAGQLPAGGHSGRISSFAEPILREEALQAQSASIDTVSGATYTSDAYAQSLQAAIDQAGIE